MQLKIIAMKLSRLNYDAVLSMANSIVETMDLNVNFPLPNPSIADLRNAIAEYKAARLEWGPEGNRSSMQARRVLLEKRAMLQDKLSQLALYAENIARGDRTMLGTVAWPLKKFKTPVGKLEAVQNLRQVFYPTVQRGTNRIDWEKPLGTSNIRINSYIVMRSATSDFKQAEMIACVSKTTFTDKNARAAGQFYWVIACGAAGQGVLSGCCFAMPIGVAA